MFESHFGLRENPFASGHQSRFVYPSHEHQEALAHLRYGIGNLEPFVLITGEVGTGKTTALFEAVVELQTRVSVALITNSALSREELLEEICLRFGVAVAPGATKPQAMALLEQHLLALRGRGERAILLLDEAQNFDRELLEEIRLFSNLEAGGESLMQIILVGQPELEAKLSLPELRQLRQRIPVHYRLRPLSLEETERYIRHRVSVAGGDAPLLFPSQTCAEVHAVTHGIPREINQLCSQAMLDAYVEGLPSVSPQHVRSAAQETTFQSVLPASETGPALPPLPAWPAAMPTPAPAAPAVPPEAPRSAAGAGEAPPSPAVQPPPTFAAPIESPGPPPLALEEIKRIEVPRAPAPPAAPPPPPAPPSPPATPAPPAPGTRYAAESALEPPAAATPARVPATPGAPGPRASVPPPRLYDRMRDEEPEPPPHTGIKLLIGVALVAVVVIGSIMLVRFGPWAKHKAPVPPAVTALPTDTMPAALNDSAAALQGIDNSLADTASGMPPATSAEGNKLAAPTRTVPPPPSPVAGLVGVTPPAPPVTTQEFGLSVGTFLDRARAASELERIAGASGLGGRIAEVVKEGTTMYAVIVGAFPDRGTAERKASELVTSGTVDEARVLARTVRTRH